MPGVRNRRRDPTTGRFVRISDKTDNPGNPRPAEPEQQDQPSESQERPSDPQPLNIPTAGPSNTEQIGIRTTPKRRQPGQGQLKQLQLRSLQEREAARTALFGTNRPRSHSDEPQRIGQGSAILDTSPFRQRQPTPALPGDTSEEESSVEFRGVLTRPDISPITPVTTVTAVFRGPPPENAVNMEPVNGPVNSSSASAGPAAATSEPPDVTQIAYPKNRYKHDAAIIVIIEQQIKEGAFPHLTAALKESDFCVAHAVLSLADRAKRDHLLESARSDVLSPNSSTTSVPAFSRFLTRFRKGPTELDEEDRNNGEREYTADQQSSRHDRADRRSTSRREPERRDVRSSHCRHRDRDNGDPSSSDSESDSDSSDNGHSRRHRRSHRRSPRKQRKHGRDHSRRSHQRRDSSPPQDLAKVKRLRVDDLKFTGQPSYPVTSYVNRIEYLAQTYGDPPVLATLPLAMTDIAQTWFDSLSSSTRRAMNNSIDEWIDQLLRRFKSNASMALKQADNMRHTFADETTLDVREYITRKIQLYNEAGEDKEDLVVRRLHEGLDPTLAAQVPLKPYRNTIDDFCAKVYSAEPTARAQYNQYESMYARLARPQIPERRPDRARESRSDRFERQDRFDRQDRFERQDRLQRPSERPPSGPYQIPVEAARRLAQYPIATAQAVAAVPPVPKPAEAVPRTRREPYPCTHCGSKQHIDPQCPDRPRRTYNNYGSAPSATPKKADRPPQSPVPVHFAEESDEDYLTTVDAQTYYSYQAMVSTFNERTAHQEATPDTPGFGTDHSSFPEPPGKEESGH